MEREEQKEQRQTLSQYTVNHIHSPLSSAPSLFPSPPLTTQEDARKVIAVASQTDDIKFTIDFVAQMKRLWADEGVHKCFERAREYQLNDCAE